MLDLTENSKLPGFFSKRLLEHFPGFILAMLNSLAYLKLINSFQSSLIISLSLLCQDEDSEYAGFFSRKD